MLPQQVDPVQVLWPLLLPQVEAWGHGRRALEQGMTAWAARACLSPLVITQAGHLRHLPMRAGRPGPMPAPLLVLLLASLLLAYLLVAAVQQLQLLPTGL